MDLPAPDDVCQSARLTLATAGMYFRKLCIRVDAECASFITEGKDVSRIRLSVLTCRVLPKARPFERTCDDPWRTAALLIILTGHLDCIWGCIYHYVSSLWCETSQLPVTRIGDELTRCIESG